MEISRVVFALKYCPVLEMHFGPNGMGLEVVMEVDSGGNLNIKIPSIFPSFLYDLVQYIHVYMFIF